MLGVSLNAIIGENGIISNAHNAAIEQKCAELEEYIQQFYVKNYDYFAQYPSKIAGIKAHSDSSSWIYAGKLGYIVDSAGDVHYYLDCDKLPEEMKEIIGTWKSKSYADYVDGNDVWGITEDLEVYYSVKNSDGNFKFFGTINPKFAKENGDEVVFNKDSNFGKLLGGEITRGDLRSVSELNLDNTSGITNFNDLYNFVSLNKLTLTNMTINSLDGLEYATNIETIFIQNCTITNYSSISKLTKLKNLFLYNETNDEIRKLCDLSVGIGGRDIITLRLFGIYGFQVFRLGYDVSYRDRNGTGGNFMKSQFSDLSYLSNLSTLTKESITHLFLNNNSIENIANLYEFKNVQVLRLEKNNITSLKGLYNEEKNIGMTNLQYLFANHNLLGKEIEEVSLNPKIDSLSSFSKATKNDDYYSFEKNFLKIDIVDLSYNSDLKFVDYLLPCNTIKKLFLAGCENLLETSVLKIAKIINACDDSELDVKYTFYLAGADNNVKKLDFSNGAGGMTLKKSAFEELLNGKEKLNWLKLNNLKLTDDNGSELSNEEFDTCLNSSLSQLSSLRYLGLNGLSKLSSLNFAEFTPLLLEIDLRGTGCTDLSKLDTYSSVVDAVLVDNANINLLTCQNLISRCDNYVLGTVGTCGIDTGGFMIGSQELATKLGNCTEITGFFMRNPLKIRFKL